MGNQHLLLAPLPPCKAPRYSASLPHPCPLVSFLLTFPCHSIGPEVLVYQFRPVRHLFWPDLILVRHVCRLVVSNICPCYRLHSSAPYSISSLYIREPTPHYITLFIIHTISPPRQHQNQQSPWSNSLNSPMNSVKRYGWIPLSLASSVSFPV